MLWQKTWNDMHVHMICLLFTFILLCSYCSHIICWYCSHIMCWYCIHITWNMSRDMFILHLSCTMLILHSYYVFHVLCWYVIPSFTVKWPSFTVKWPSFTVKWPSFRVNNSHSEWNDTHSYVWHDALVFFLCAHTNVCTKRGMTCSHVWYVM